MIILPVQHQCGGEVSAAFQINVASATDIPDDKNIQLRNRSTARIGRTARFQIAQFRITEIITDSVDGLTARVWRHRQSQQNRWQECGLAKRILMKDPRPFSSALSSLNCRFQQRRSGSQSRLLSTQSLMAASGALGHLDWTRSSWLSSCRAKSMEPSACTVPCRNP